MRMCGRVIGSPVCFTSNSAMKYEWPGLPRRAGRDPLCVAQSVMAFANWVCVLVSEMSLTFAST
eukprot:15442978-Alexandrium_andersonii.AAC.1